MKRGVCHFKDFVMDVYQRITKIKTEKKVQISIYDVA